MAERNKYGGKIKTNLLPNRKQLVKHIFTLLDEGKRCGGLPQNLKDNLLIYADALGLEIDFERWTVK